MFLIIYFLVFLALGVVLLAIYNMVKQNYIIESFKRDFVEVFNEAEQLKDDLNIMMENALDISRLLVEELDTKAAHSEIIKETGIKPILSAKDNNKIRIYQLAHQVNMNSKDLLIFLAKQGYDYSSHMNTIDNDLVALVKKVLLEVDFETQIPYLEEKLGIAAITEPEERDFDLEQIKNSHPYIAVSLLLERGYNIIEIAKILDRGVGEIDLIINLSKKTKAL